MPKYYRMRVCDITAESIRGMCDELLFATRYAPASNYDLEMWRWLVWFFQENLPPKMTASLFTPDSLLTTKISKLCGTPIYDLLREIAAERHVGLEMQENVNVLTFLKRVFRDSMPQGRRSA